MKDNLPPLPPCAPEFKPRWATDPGGYNEDQMKAYARAAIERQSVPATQDAANLLDRFERQWHRMGELWERCQGKGWPDIEGAEFESLRDEKSPATRAALLALLAAAPQPQPVHDDAVWNKGIRDSVDSLLAQAGYQPDSSARHQLAMMNFDPSPQAQPPSDEQIADAYEATMSIQNHLTWAAYRAGARFAETQHGITKGKTSPQAQPQPLTGLILPKHFDPLTGAGIPDPTTFGKKQ